MGSGASCLHLESGSSSFGLQKILATLLCPFPLSVLANCPSPASCALPLLWAATPASTTPKGVKSATFGAQPREPFRDPYHLPPRALCSWLAQGISLWPLMMTPPGPNSELTSQLSLQLCIFVSRPALSVSVSKTLSSQFSQNPHPQDQINPLA